MYLCARTVEMIVHLMTDSPPARLHVLTEKPLSVHKAGYPWAVKSFVHDSV